MRSVQVVRLEGPSGVEVVQADEPTAGDGEVLVEVRALGVAWPDLLLSRGEYQVKPELPFQLGVDVAGTVAEAPEGSELSAGDRVACCLPYGGGADLVAVPSDSVFPLPDGGRSVAYRLTFQADDRTLTDEEINAVHARVAEAVSRRFGITLRGS